MVTPDQSVQMVRGDCEDGHRVEAVSVAAALRMLQGPLFPQVCAAEQRGWLRWPLVHVEATLRSPEAGHRPAHPL